MSTKKCIIGLIQQVENGAYSNIVLNETFKKNNMTSGEKSFVTEVFYGVLRNQIFIDHMLALLTKNIKKVWIKNLLRLSIYQITFMRSDNAGVVYEAAELTKQKYGLPVSKFVNAVLRQYLRIYEAEIEKLKNEKAFNILYSYPLWFCDFLKKEYGENFEATIESYKKVPYTSFRINTLKYTEAEFENLLKENNINIIKKVETVYYVDNGSLISSSEFIEGKIIIQDGSYLAAKNLEPKENEKVLDICAAPGSKTVLLAELMKNKGEILALDIHPHKIKLIESNAKKLGIDIIKAMTLDARKVNMQGKKFNKILVDAPCSGYGVIRKKPEILVNAKPEKNSELASLQLEILLAAADILEDDGAIIYSTCTINSQENTENIKKFLALRKDFCVDKLSIAENVSGSYDDCGGFLVDYKEEIMDSFYIARLIKNRKEKD